MLVEKLWEDMLSSLLDTDKTIGLQLTLGTKPGVIMVLSRSDLENAELILKFMLD